VGYHDIGPLGLVVVWALSIARFVDEQQSFHPHVELSKRK